MKTNLRAWLAEHQSFVAGLAGALAIVLQQFATGGDISLKAIGIAVFVAVLGFVGKFFKGTGFTATGILAAVAEVVAVRMTGEDFTWQATILAGALAVLGLFSQGLQFKDETDADTATPTAGTSA